MINCFCCDERVAKESGATANAKYTSCLCGDLRHVQLGTQQSS